MTVAVCFIFLSLLRLILSSNPFYYFAPSTEGFGSRYLQFKAIYYEVVIRNSRPLVVMANKNGLHHGDLKEKETSLCDIIAFPSTVSCLYNQTLNIIREKSCEIPTCVSDDWYCSPSKFITTRMIMDLSKTFSPEISISLEELNKKLIDDYKPEYDKQFEQLAYSDESFRYAGVNMVDRVDFSTSGCAMLYMYHKVYPLHEDEVKYYQSTHFTTFSAVADSKFKKIMLSLQQNTGMSWYDDIYLAHYRRGDKVHECNSPQFATRWNCKDISTFIKHLQELTGPDKKLYIATNEDDPEKLKILHNSTITGAFYNMNEEKLKINSFDLMTFELQLMIHAKRAFFIDGASAMQYFVNEGRLDRGYSPIEILK